MPYTPWNTLVETLNSSRYAVFENAFKKVVNG